AGARLPARRPRRPPRRLNHNPPFFSSPLQNRNPKVMRTASAHAMEIVKATAPALEKHGLAITTAMYAPLFRTEEIEAMFERAAQTSGDQPKRLAAAIPAYAKNIDTLQNLGPAVSRMPSLPAPRTRDIGARMAKPASARSSTL